VRMSNNTLRIIANAPRYTKTFTSGPSGNWVKKRAWLRRILYKNEDSEQDAPSDGEDVLL
jgi:hypothetical protein